MQWLKIATELGTGRLAGECLTHNQQQRMAAVARAAPWSKSEDAALKAAHINQGKNWAVRHPTLFAEQNG